MKKATITLIGLFCLVIPACNIVRTDPRTLSSGEAGSNTVSVSSKTRSSKPQKSYTIDDFPEYRQNYGAYSYLFYWRDEDGDYMCGTIKRGSSTWLSTGTLASLQENPCPAHIMKEIIAEYRSKFSGDRIENYLGEASYPLDPERCDEFWSHGYVSTREREIYTLLGIEEDYERRFAGSRAVYFDHFGLFDDETDYAYKVFPKYFTNLSHIYRWTNAEGEIRYGVFSQMDDGMPTTLDGVTYMQNKCSCSADVIKKIIAAYYKKTNVAPENLIVDIPIFEGSAKDYKERIYDAYPNNVSSDLSIYKELGIEASYHSHFDK